MVAPTSNKQVLQQVNTCAHPVLPMEGPEILRGQGHEDGPNAWIRLPEARRVGGKVTERPVAHYYVGVETHDVVFAWI